GAGKRLPDPMTPLIITRDGKPVLASTVIGAGMHQRKMQVLAGILEFGQDAPTAVDAPALLLPTSKGDQSIARVSQGGFDSKILEGVRLLGQEVKELGVEARGDCIGYWAGIQIDPSNRLLQGAGTKELPNHAAGY